MTQLFDSLQLLLFERLVQPVLVLLEAQTLLEDAYQASEWFLAGCLQLLVIAVLFVPLERMRPVERVVDRHTIRVDMLYSAIHRLGLFRAAVFLLMQTLLDETAVLLNALADIGVSTWHVDQIVPGLTDIAWVSFVLYLVVFDLADYWIHRGQHAMRLWWALHSLHHAQRQMTAWSDNRNHLVDDLVRDIVFALLSFAVGVSPAQYLLMVACTQLMESLQHSNCRISFGRWGNRLIVSPVFHRLHHSVEYGFGKNFGVLFPWWDMLFGTAKFDVLYKPTGVDDAEDYGGGFWAQQYLGVVRLVRAAGSVLPLRRNAQTGRGL